MVKMGEIKLIHNGYEFYEVPTHTGHSYTPSVHWFYTHSYWEKPYPSPIALLKARNDLG
jgi:hypothetical protein